MASTKPSPRTWTLRFKSSKTTILLHVDPLQKLNSIKADLLKALNQTNPSGTLNSIPIPTDPGSIRLAKPLDINDLSLGWQPLDADIDAEELDADGEKPRTKGKGRNKAKNSLLDCPQGVGMRDGGVVAFKFGEDLHGMGDQEDEAVVVEGAEEKWDVDVPTLEAAFDDEEEREGVR